MSRSKELILLAQRIRALSQTGLVYSLSEYDTERYEELSRLSDEITALATGLKPDDVASGYRPAQEYVTPKVDIRAVVFNEKDEILLVREKMDGCWSLPGGWSDVGIPERGSGERGERGDGLGCASGPLAGRDGYEQASASRYTLLCI